MCYRNLVNNNGKSIKYAGIAARLKTSTLLLEVAANTLH